MTCGIDNIEKWKTIFFLKKIKKTLILIIYSLFIHFKSEKEKYEQGAADSTPKSDQ